MDTNVAVVANGGANQADIACVESCVKTLRQIRDGQRLLLDDKGLILREYRNHLSPSGQPGPGDAFFKWIWENQANEDSCRTVPVACHADRAFEEFPNDPSLSSFDMSDRKFVAVAIACGTDPKVLNASDTDWWNYRQVLRRHGVLVKFLCPGLMAVRGNRLHDQKL